MRLGLSMALPVIPISASILLDDYFWNLVSTGNISPKESGDYSTDRNDIWELDDDDDPPDIMPEVKDDMTSAADEGYWELDASGNIQPLDI